METFMKRATEMDAVYERVAKCNSGKNEEQEEVRRVRSAARARRIKYTEYVKAAHAAEEATRKVREAAAAAERAQRNCDRRMSPDAPCLFKAVVDAFSALKRASAEARCSYAQLWMYLSDVSSIVDKRQAAVYAKIAQDAMWNATALHSNPYNDDADEALLQDPECRDIILRAELGLMQASSAATSEKAIASASAAFDAALQREQSVRSALIEARLCIASAAKNAAAAEEVLDFKGAARALKQECTHVTAALALSVEVLPLSAGVLKAQSALLRAQGDMSAAQHLHFDALTIEQAVCAAEGVGAASRGVFLAL